MANVIPLTVSPLTRAAFAPFGDVIETAGADSFLINNGTTERFHALATADVVDGDVITSIFRGQPFVPPVEITMMERHPLGSQAFIPLNDRPWFVVVAPDEDGQPGHPVAFIAQGHQGVQYGRGIWHHPLIVLEASGDFLVIDRSGEGSNLEESNLTQSFSVDRP